MRTIVRMTTCGRAMAVSVPVYSDRFSAPSPWRGRREATSFAAAPSLQRAQSQPCPPPTPHRSQTRHHIGRHAVASNCRRRSGGLLGRHRMWCNACLLAAAHASHRCQRMRGQTGLRCEWTRAAMHAYTARVCRAGGGTVEGGSVARGRASWRCSRRADNSELIKFKA
eukprot:1658063-Prymnesium_polylepis.1